MSQSVTHRHVSLAVVVVSQAARACEHIRRFWLHFITFLPVLPQRATGQTPLTRVSIGRLQYRRIFAFNSTPHSLGLLQASLELASPCGHTSQPHLLMQLYRWNKVIKSTESLVVLWLYTVWVDNDSSLSANNGALHSVINAAGFWKALWKSEAVGADDVEGAIEGMWQHALLQLRAVEGLHDSSPCASANDARAMLQRAHCSGCPAFGPGTYELDFSFMRLSQRRSFKVEPSLLEWICFSRTPEAITITCVPVLPPPHVLNGRPPSSYLPMCDRALPPSFSLL